jgi:hypothetical protein
MDQFDSEEKTDITEDKMTSKDEATRPGKSNTAATIVGIIGALIGFWGLQRALGDSDAIAFYTQCPLAIVLLGIAWFMWQREK